MMVLHLLKNILVQVAVLRHPEKYTLPSGTEGRYHQYEEKEITSNLLRVLTIHIKISESTTSRSIIRVLQVRSFYKED